ncbi:MAG: helix-turn-helix transcriptional regulator [Caulobacteraceae bacterium]
MLVRKIDVHGAGTEVDALYLVNAQGLASPLTRRSAMDQAQPLRPIEVFLGLRASELIGRLRVVVDMAVHERRRGVLLWRDPRDDTPGMLLTVTPAREPGCAVVRVGPLDSLPSLPDATAVAELFGISPAEADIALGVMQDESLSLIADRRGVQLETVRGQLKTLLHKMGLSSQKQLVRVLTRLAVAEE